MGASRAFAIVVLVIFLVAIFSALAYVVPPPRRGQPTTSTRAASSTRTARVTRTTSTTATETTTSPPAPQGSALAIVEVIPRNTSGVLNVTALVFYDGFNSTNLTYAALRWPNGTVACSRELNITVKYYSDTRVWVSCEGVPFRPGEQIYITVMGSANETASYEITVP